MTGQPPVPRSHPAHRCRRRLVLLAWGIVVLVGVAASSQLFDLPSNLDPAPSTEAERTEARIAELTGTDGRIVALVDGDPAAPELAAQISATSEELRALDGVDLVLEHPSTGAETLVASDRSASLIVASLRAGLDDDQTDLLLAHIRAAVDARLGDRARLAGGSIIDQELGDTAESDFLRADLLALPVVLALLGLVLRSRRVIAIGAAMVIVTVTGSFAALFALSKLTDVSVFAINVVTMFGIGLTVDYCLLVIGAHRRERAAGHPPAEAAHRAAWRAGRVVTFSGLTVAAALAGLVALREPVIRSLGYGGIAATLIAVTATRTLLPLLLERHGHAIPPAPTGAIELDAGPLARLAHLLGRHAGIVTLTSLAVLAVLALPLTRLTLTGLDERSLPPGTGTRVISDAIAEKFPALDPNPVQVLIEPAPDPESLDRFVSATAALSGAGNARPSQIGPVTVVDVSTGRSASGPVAQRLVEAIRALDPPTGSTVGVTGEAAEDVDLARSIAARLPVALAITVGGTLLLLFLFTRSILIPLKAVAVTAASLAASLGALVWVFQDGHGAGVLGFTPIGGLDTVTVLLAATFAFGLSTDYEVFLLGAVLDERRRGATTATAIAHGLQRTGRTITTAAALLVVVFTGFATGELAVVKQLGIGLSIAVILDATLIRLVLVPSTMTLAGQANWWAPRPLQRLGGGVRVERS